ncbi:uncharacterized protein [Diadema setosum]|uniref:uncharacterized protein n=1 Tax=Diadema antillarum TaxID=105358 RepID=UPI003A844619
MEKRSFSLPDDTSLRNEKRFMEGVGLCRSSEEEHIQCMSSSSCELLKRDGIMELPRTSPNSRRRVVVSDVMPAQRQSSREHSNHHVNELPELREEEPLGADGGVMQEHELEAINAHLHPPPGVARRSRRSSAPTLLEPIQEGLFGRGRRNSTPSVMPVTLKRDTSLSPARCNDSPPSRSPRLPSKFGQPMFGMMPEEDLAIRLQRRRRSESDHELGGIQAHTLYTTESFFPQPRRNSLATSTLNDIASRFELLDTRRRVVEESENRGPAMPYAGNHGGLRCEGGAPPPISVTETY